MKKIGLIGGIGPESTLDYYRRIIDAARERTGGLGSPEIIIYSADVQEMMTIMDANAPERLTAWLLAKMEAAPCCRSRFCRHHRQHGPSGL